MSQGEEGTVVSTRAPEPVGAYPHAKRAGNLLFLSGVGPRKRGSKAVVRRDVVRLVTPGTLTEDSLLEARQNNYLAALARVRGDGDLASPLGVDGLVALKVERAVRRSGAGW